jgi:hypothetical protein
MKGFFSNYYFTGTRTTTCTSLRVLLVCRSRRAREKAFENSAAERCGFSSGQCLFFSQGNAIKQISESTFSLFFFLFVTDWEAAACSSGTEVFFVVLDISAFESVIKCHRSAVTTFKLSF